MKFYVAFITLVSASVASAQPKPAPAKPAKPVVCAPGYSATSRMQLVGSDPIACWKEDNKPETCVAIPSSGAPRSVPPPPAATPAVTAEVRDEGGKLSACTGSKCVKLGKKLAASIAKEAATKGAKGADYFGDAIPHVSTDLKLATVNGTPWSVAGDKPLKLSPPVEYKKNKEEKPSLGSVDIVGNLGIATWSNCAGPCGMAVVIDSKGKNKGKSFPSGFAIPLDDKRLVIVPSDADSQLTVLDMSSAKQLHTLKLGDGVLELTNAVKIDSTNVLAIWSADGAWTIASISLPADKPPTVTKRSIPSCP